jgi:hypothetical protein
MPRTELTEITEPNLQGRVRARYQREIGALQGIGFVPLAYCHEALEPYSAISQIPLVFLMWPKKEVLTVTRPFRLGVANVLLVHTSPPSIALCMGMGVKFYSAFSGGYLLVSPSFESPAIPKPGTRIIKSAPGPTLEKSWLSHIQQVKQQQDQGKILLNTKSFADFREMSEIENDESQYFLPAIAD